MATRAACSSGARAATNGEADAGDERGASVIAICPRTPAHATVAPLMRRASILIAALGALALGAAPGLAHNSANRLSLTASNVNGSVGAVTTGATWSVDGSMSHFVKGQKVVVHAFDDGKLILRKRVALTRAGFHVSITVAAVGRVTVRAIHFRSRRAPFMVTGNAPSPEASASNTVASATIVRGSPTTLRNASTARWVRSSRTPGAPTT